MLNQSRPDLKIPKESRFLELGIRLPQRFRQRPHNSSTNAGTSAGAGGKRLGSFGAAAAF
jgi:hypothetical protein